MAARRSPGRALLVLSMLGGAGSLAVLLVRQREVSSQVKKPPSGPALAPAARDPEEPKPVSVVAPRSPVQQTLVNPEAQDDRTALARMLASETEDFGERVVVGWITVEVAKRRKTNLFQLLTKGKGYGEQLRGSESFYAGTSQPPTPVTARLADRLLAGTLRPSAAIRAVRPGAWVERGQRGKQNVTDRRIVELQAKFNEGIWARLVSEGRPTKWILFSAEKPQRQPAADQTATSFLERLEPVEALDMTSEPQGPGGPLVA